MEADLSVGLEALSEKARAIAKAIKDPAERALDIRNPYQPREVGYFIPAMTEATEKRCFKIDGQERCTTSVQSNNVEIDDRGYIYVVDRANTGLHIVRLTGDAAKIIGN
jgi:hypothetical protein